jgi:hypothetical protein
MLLLLVPISCTPCNQASDYTSREHKSRARTAYERLRLEVGAFAAQWGPTAAARQFHVGVGFAKYNLRKFLDPTFHSGGLGGARHNLFSEDEEPVVETLLYRLSLLNPVQSAPELSVRL